GGVLTYCVRAIEGDDRPKGLSRRVSRYEPPVQHNKRGAIGVNDLSITIAPAIRQHHVVASIGDSKAKGGTGRVGVLREKCPDIRTVGSAGAICGARRSTGAPASFVWVRTGAGAQWCSSNRNSSEETIRPNWTGSYFFRLPIQEGREHFTVGRDVVH